MNVRDLVPWLENGASEHRDPFLGLHRRLSCLFDDALPTRLTSSSAFDVRGHFSDFSPKVNVAESDASYTVTIEVPGIDEKDIKVQLKERILTISGERKSASDKADEKGPVYRESSFGTFRRSMKLGSDIKEDDVTASLKNGVLTITLPKRAEEDRAGKTIAVRSE